jgi:DNA-binding CsgD family transcriptional regulator
MCLHREDVTSGFTADELDLVRRVAPHIGEGLRRAVLLRATAGPEPSLAVGPGVVVLGEDLAVTSMNAQAEHWLEELRDGPSADGLPFPVHVAAMAAQASRDTDPELSTHVRLRTVRGDWLTVYASPMSGSGGRATSITLEPARPLQLASLYLDAHGLTPAQTRVAELVLQGWSTQQIVNHLRISAYTVQEHLGVVFDKIGIGSRRELVAVLLGSASRA